MATKTLVSYKAEGATSNNLEVKVTDGTTSLLLDGATVLAGQQAAIADLNQTISGTYTQAEVQAISDKVDAILAMLRLQGIIAS